MNNQLVLICQHYWEFPEPNGRESVGVCKYCHETKVFYNSFDDDKIPLNLRDKFFRVRNDNPIDQILSRRSNKESIGFY